jgi:hypothetical protein
VLGFPLHPPISLYSLTYSPSQQPRGVF